MPLDPNSRLIDVMLGLAALATAFTLGRSWKTFWDADFTVDDRRLANQAAVFLVPPVVVLFHELGHVVAALGVGARVLSFHYGFFEGSVGVGGGPTAAADLVIALAGNVVGAAVGSALALAGSRARSMPRPLRHVLLVGGLLEVAFTLVGYPVLSLAARFGDWLVVYDLRSTPGLSLIVAAIHAVVVIGLWRWWQGTLRPTLFALDHGVEGELDRRRQAVVADPHDVHAHLELAELYARHGDAGLARTALDHGARRCPRSAPLHLARARLALWRGRYPEAAGAAHRGLEAPQDDGEISQRLWANLGLALASMARPADALAAFGHLSPPLSEDPRVDYGRGIARLESGDGSGGRADLEAALEKLPEGDPLRRWAEARLAGEDLAAAGQAGHAPPRAPIAGL